MEELRSGGPFEGRRELAMSSRSLDWCPSEVHFLLNGKPSRLQDLDSHTYMMSQLRLLARK